jgi:hypothetical protein
MWTMDWKELAGSGYDLPYGTMSAFSERDWEKKTKVRIAGPQAENQT